MARVGVYVRSGDVLGRDVETYFITLEFTRDCWFRWTRLTDGWHKLYPRVPIP